MQIPGLKIHIRAVCPPDPDLFKHHLEIPFKLSPASGAQGKTPRIEHSCIIRECHPKGIPFEVIEGTNELSKRLPDLLLIQFG